MPQDVSKEPALVMGTRRFAIQRAVLFVFCLVFSAVLIGIVFFNSRYDIRGLYIIPVILLYMLAMLWISHIARRFGRFFERRFNALMYGCIIFMLIANIALGFLLRFEPIFDLGAIYTGAIEWASSGGFMENINPTCDPYYFYYFPNNLGGMTLLYFVFKVASFIGVTDYFAAAMISNALLIALTIMISVLIARSLFGVSGGVTLMALFMLSPPWYTMGAVFYTDSLSLLFPVLAFYLYLKYDKSHGTGMRALLGVLTAITIAFGMLIKFTVFIALIAIVIYELYARGLKRVLVLVSFTLPVILLINILFNGYFYSNHIDRDTASRLNTPYTHWVMMSLNGKGAYNPYDYEFTRSFDDPKERDAAIRDEIARRIANLGPDGLSLLLFNKSIAAFGDGTLSQSDFLDDNPQNRTAIHEYLLYDGMYHTVYKYLCGGVFFAIQAFMLFGAYSSLIRGHDEGICLVLRLCALGVLCFLALWEISGRYITNYTPVLMLLCIPGAELMSERIFAHIIKS